MTVQKLFLVVSWFIVNQSGIMLTAQETHSVSIAISKSRVLEATTISAYRDDTTEVEHLAVPAQQPWTEPSHQSVTPTAYIKDDTYDAGPGTEPALNDKLSGLTTGVEDLVAVPGTEPPQQQPTSSSVTEDDKFKDATEPTIAKEITSEEPKIQKAANITELKQDSVEFATFRDVAEKFKEVAFDTTLHLYTRENGGDFQLLDVVDNRSDGITSEFRAFSATNFKPKTQTVFIIHGIADGPKVTTWPLRLKNAILKRRNYNVIIVDWSLGASFPVEQAIVNARRTVTTIIRAVNRLVRFPGMHASSIHLIGHGLGCHIAGLVGKAVHGIGRITGLDPLGTIFRTFPPEDRLSHSDAEFIDIIHTNSAERDEFGIGAPLGLGHLEFFANDGQRQPGCIAESKAGLTKKYPYKEGFFKTYACDHFRAVELFINFMTYADSCVPVAYACADYLSYLKGNCVECNKRRDCAIVGMRATQLDPRVATERSLHRRFFFKTAVQPPYCLIQHHVQVSLSRQQMGHLPGELLITITGPFGSASASIESGYTGFVPGSAVVTLLSSKRRIGRVAGVGIMWRPFFSNQPIKIDYVRVLAMNFIETKMRQRRTGFFCVAGNQLLHPHVPISLYAAEQCHTPLNRPIDVLGDETPVDAVIEF